MAAPESISQLLENINESIAAKRRMLRIIETPRFQLAYAEATVNSKLKVSAFINSDNQEGVERWIKDQTVERFETMTLRELREYGRRYGIRYYARLPHSMLLSEVVAYAKSAGHNTSNVPSANSVGRDALRAVFSA